MSDENVALVRTVFEAIQAQDPDAYLPHIDPGRFTVSGNDVVVALHERGKSARSDLTIEDRFAHVWTVRDRQVVRIRVFNDEREALAAAESLST